MKIEDKYFPYKEGDYTIEFDGAHKITPEIHEGNIMCRSTLWPLMLTIILALLPIVLIHKIYNKLCKRL